ncbi:MAG: ester cyclase [Rhodothermales bacterium]|nr:ester cyclase [Rhodothermales bacterium]
MNVEHNKQLVRRILTEGMAPGNMDVIDEAVADDYVNHDFPMPAPGREGFKQALAMFNTAFPDGEIVVEDQVAEGHKVVTRGVWKGTHAGPFMGVAPTGKQASLPFIDIWTVKDGRGHENWVQMDLMGLMQQFGAVSAPEEAGA